MAIFLTVRRSLSLWCPFRWLLSLVLTFAGWQHQVSALDVSSNPASLTTTLGISLNASLIATGGTGTITYTVAVVSPSTGLTITPTVTGTTLTVSSSGTAGTATIRITGTDTLNATDTHDIPITVNAGIVVTSDPTSLTTTLGVSRTAILSATGGTGTITFTVAVVSPSTGLTITPTVSGTTLTVANSGTAGTATIRITGTDTLNATDTHDIPITVNAGIAVTSPPAAVGVTLGTTFNANLTSTGGTGAVTYTAVVQSFSPGMTITPTVSGTALSINSSVGTGTAVIRVTGTDTVGAAGVRDVTVTVNAAIAVTALPDAINTTLGRSKEVVLTITGGTGTVALSTTLVSGVAIARSFVGTTLTLSPSGSAGTAVVRVTGTDTVGAIATRDIAVTVNALPSVSIVAPVTPIDESLRMTVNGSLEVTVAVTGGTGQSTITAAASSMPPGRTITVVGSVITVAAGATVADFDLTITATDVAGATASVTKRVEVKDPLVWATQPTGTAMVISTGGTSARPSSLPCAISGGHNNPTTTITLADGSALPAFLSVTRSGSALDIALANNPTGLPTVTTSFPLKITVNDNKTTIQSTFTVVWFVNQSVVPNTTTPAVLAYPLANPGYTGVIGSTTFSDPAGSVAGAPNLLAASGFSSLFITCTRVNAVAPITSWQVGQDQLLCRSSADIFVDRNELKLGGTTVVATWDFDSGTGRLSITANANAATTPSGVDLLNQLLATIAYTNPAGNFATEPTVRRRVSLVVRASDVRGTNLSSTAWVRDIAFTSQPPVFDQIAVEPGERKALQLSFTPSRTDLLCTVNPPGPSAGAVVNAADSVITQFTLAEVIQGSIFYKSVDGSLSADSFTLTVVDGDGVLLSDRVNVPVTISLGSGLTMIGEPIRFVTPVAGTTTTWNAVARGPGGTTATVSVVPWFGESGTVTGVAPQTTSQPLVGLTNIPIVITWSQLATVVTDGTTTTTTYPSFLRFRVRLTTTDATVEQPLVVRVLGPTVPRAAELTGNN